MVVKPGDRIVLSTKMKRMAPRERVGTIERVLDPGQPRLEVRWDDGRLTTVAPQPDAFRIEAAAKKTRSAAKKKDESYAAVTPTREKLKASERRVKVRKN